MQTEENSDKPAKEKSRFAYKHALLFLIAIGGLAYRAAPYIKEEMEYRDKVARYNSGQMKR